MPLEVNKAGAEGIGKNPEKNVGEEWSNNDLQGPFITMFLTPAFTFLIINLRQPGRMERTSGSGKSEFESQFCPLLIGKLEQVT